MPTIRGNKTIREAGLLVASAIESADYSNSIEPETSWFWSLEMENQLVPIMRAKDGWLIAITPDYDGPITITQADSCGSNANYSLLVLLLKRMSTTGTNDAAGDLETEECALFSQEVGEALAENPSFVVQTPRAFIDVSMLRENRIFASAWEVEIS